MAELNIFAAGSRKFAFVYTKINSKKIAPEAGVIVFLKN